MGESLANVLGETSIVNTAHEAIVEVDNFLPDLLVADFNLPGGNVLELLYEMQSFEDLRKIPVIILADDERIQQPDLAKLNVKKVLQKQKFTPAEFGDEVARWQ
jgi:CheY-like chemotaxis protein